MMQRNQLSTMSTFRCFDLSNEDTGFKLDCLWQIWIGAEGRMAGKVRWWWLFIGCKIWPSPVRITAHTHSIDSQHTTAAA